MRPCLPFCHKWEKDWHSVMEETTKVDGIVTEKKVMYVTSCVRCGCPREKFVIEKGEELKKRCGITIKSAEEFPMRKSQLNGFILTIKPFTEKNKEKEYKLKDQLSVAFKYNSEDGIEIEQFCEFLEDTAANIREHYK